MIQAHASALQKLKSPIKDEKYSRIIADNLDYDKAIERASKLDEDLNKYSM